VVEQRWERLGLDLTPWRNGLVSPIKNLKVAQANRQRKRALFLRKVSPRKPTLLKAR
jgi:hypothetical protein